MTDMTSTDAPQFEAPFQIFLETARDGDFIIFVDPEHERQFVQYKRNHGVIYGEVSSRQWETDGSNQPLSDQAEFALMRLGFTHGGAAKNYAQDNLPPDPRALALLTKRLFTTAYEMPAPARPQITTTAPDVASWASRRDQFLPVGKPKNPPGPTCPCGYSHRDEPPLKTTPGLAARALRALHSNFMEIQLDCEDRIRFRAAVEAVTRFEDLPDWAQDYILKAEEGPLW